MLGQKDRPSPFRPPGGEKTLKRAVLEAGASLLQSAAPLKDFDVYVTGFHCAKHHPEEQMEAHHYCKQVNDDLLQCVVFDGNTADANLIGVEYIISERLFDTLPEEEKKYWHPHNYEIFSGTLVAPGLPDVAEQALMRLLVNSYGKTWHTWHTGRHDGQGRPADPLPYGDAMLMWSFNRDGELDGGLERHLAEALGVDFDAKRAARQAFVDAARPQCGVDALKDAFPDATPEPPPGVRESGACREDERG